MPDYGEFKDLRDRKREASMQGQKYQVEAQRRVALHVEYVTQSEHWNVYLEHLQALNQADQKALQHAQNKVLSVEPMTNEERMAHLIQFHKLQSKISTRIEDMQLPQLLMKQGEAAKETEGQAPVIH